MTKESFGNSIFLSKDHVFSVVQYSAVQIIFWHKNPKIFSKVLHRKEPEHNKWRNSNMFRFQMSGRYSDGNYFVASSIFTSNA